MGIHAGNILSSNAVAVMIYFYISFNFRNLTYSAYMHYSHGTKIHRRIFSAWLGGYQEMVGKSPFLLMREPT